MRTRVDPLLAGALALAVLVRIGFWGYTGRRFEDALITVAHARNAAEGLGLVHHVEDDRVQGFTSALSALIPLAGELVASGAGFTAIRLVSLAAAAAAIVYAWRIAGALGLGRWPTGFVLVYLAIDHNQILFGMAGMETQIAVAVLLAAVWYLIDGRSPAKLGVAIGLALLARPDMILLAVAALAWLAHARRSHLATVAAVAAVLVAPWVIFTVVYYGTPVPHTILAKSAGFRGPPPLSAGPGELLSYLADQPGEKALFWRHFVPFWESWAVHAAPLPAPFSKALALVLGALAVGGAILTRRVRGWLPAIFFAVLWFGYFVFGGRLDMFSWYLPPFLALMMLLVAASLTRMRRAGVPLAALLAALFAAATPYAFRLERAVQKDIEDEVRTEVGKYLNRVVARGQTVTSESSGYVGYYGRVKLYDFPGLTSPHALSVLKRIPREQRTFPALAVKLETDWIVARPQEWIEMIGLDPAMARRYRPVAAWARNEAAAPLSLGSVDYRVIDRVFIVLKRQGVRPLRGDV